MQFFPEYNIFLKIGGLQIHMYAVCIIIGAFIAYLLGQYNFKKLGYSSEILSDYFFGVLMTGIIGARIWYVIFMWKELYASHPEEIIAIWHGGLAIHGGIIAGILVVYFYTKKYKMKFLKTLDISVVGIIIAQAIGRWGNFFNQEAFGKLTTKAALIKQRIPNFIIEGMYIDGAYYQPTFLYESVWNLIGFIIMLFLRRTKKLKVGYLTGFYLIWYSLGRCFIEYFRSDSLMLGNIKVAQLISLSLIVIGIIVIIKSTKKNELYN